MIDAKKLIQPYNKPNVPSVQEKQLNTLLDRIEMAIKNAHKQGVRDLFWTEIRNCNYATIDAAMVIMKEFGFRAYKTKIASGDCIGISW